MNVAHSRRGLSRLIQFGRCRPRPSAPGGAERNPTEGALMGNLIAVAYPDESTAKDVLATLARLQTEKSIELEDAVVVTRSMDGKVKLHQTAKTGAAGATGGALWGGLIGLL